MARCLKQPRASHVYQDPRHGGPETYTLTKTHVTAAMPRGTLTDSRVFISHESSQPAKHPKHVCLALPHTLTDSRVFLSHESSQPAKHPKHVCCYGSLTIVY